MKKGKRIVTLVIDKEVLKMFDKYCETFGASRSGRVQALMKADIIKKYRI